MPINKPATTLDRHNSTTSGPIGGPPSPVVERCGESVVVMDPSGVIVSWNDAARHLYGFSPEEVLGRPITDFVASGAEQPTLALLSQAAVGGALQRVRVLRRHRNGSFIAAIVDLTPVPTAHLPRPLAAAARATAPSPWAPSLEAVPSDPTDPTDPTDPSEPTVPSQRTGPSEPAVPTVDPTSPASLATMLSHLPGVVFHLDPRGLVTFCAGHGLEELGLQPEDAIGVDILDMCDDETSRGLATRLLEGHAVSGPCSIAGTIWEIECEPMWDQDGNLTGIRGVLHDAETTRAHRETLALTAARFRALVLHSSDLVAVVDDALIVTYVSPSVTELLGYEPADVIGLPAVRLVHPEDVRLVRERTGRVAREADRSMTFDLRLRHADGTWRDYELVNSDFLDDASVRGTVINGRDITERREADRRLRHASLHDALTDLPNRSSLLAKIDELLTAVATQTQSNGVEGAVVAVVLGLDRFKLVNDSLGHDAGDRLLVAVAERLRAATQPFEIVARLAGDSFAVASRYGPERGAPAAIAEHVLAAFAEPIDLGDRRIAVSARAGVAMSEPGDDAALLVRNADAAMYEAKSSGGTRVVPFDRTSRARASRRLDLEQALRMAVPNGELRVHFQPVVSLDDGCIVGAEALVRWQHPTLGLIPPLDFIPLAEETGDIVEIGNFVLRESCRAAAGWARDGLSLQLSVNLSPRQLVEQGFPHVVETILEETGFDAHQLTLEVTETVLVDEGHLASETLTRLRGTGMHLAIDDFGTGYSSLVYLRRLRADALKIDRSFISGLGHDDEDEVIVRTVINLARSLGLELVAEGVETESQRQLLVDLGCRFAQGFLFSRPVDQAAFWAWQEDREQSPSTRL